MPNTAQLDPTRTATLRRQFTNEVNKRLTLFLSLLKAYQQPPGHTYLDVSGFAQLAEELALRTLTEYNQPQDQRYTTKLVTAAYLQGYGQSYQDVKGVEEWTNKRKNHSAAKRGFTDLALLDPVNRQTLDNLISRTEAEFRLFATDVATRLTRVYADSLVLNIRLKPGVATALGEAIGTSYQKAAVIISTEISRAHAEGKLDAYHKLGIYQVKVLVEWTTAGDSKVCKLCKPLEAVVLTLAEARGLFPRHPNCRCSPQVAAYTGKMPISLERARRGRVRAVQRSIKAEKPKRYRKPGRPAATPWAKQAKKNFKGKL